MKKIYVKYKILVNGLNTMDEYEIEKFILKTGNINTKYFDNKHSISENGMDIDLNRYFSAFVTDYEKLSYRYFESSTFHEFEVSNKTKINQNNIISIIGKYSKILDIPNNLEKMLRIKLNIPLCFLLTNLEIYDENKNIIARYEVVRNFLVDNRCFYNLDPYVFSNNSRFSFNYETYMNLDNNNYKKALEFYNDSFESSKISTRYVLIFSSLEAIFNLDSEDITKKLARYCAKLLSENNENEYKIIYKNISDLCNKRSHYIHGNKRGNISLEDEQLLRMYVRKIILSYFMIATISKKT